MRNRPTRALSAGDASEEPADPDADDDSDERVPVVRRVASQTERLRERDFAQLTSAELAQLATLMRELVIAVPPRRTRRYRPIRLAEATHETLRETDLFRPEFLLSRPLLTALDHPGPRPAVLLIDEVDRADDEFEAFLFEMLAESSVTIPELGTRHAVVPPVVILTSNRTRDLHDALKRRCLYHWIGFPDARRVAEIIRRRVPAATAALAGEVAVAVARLRELGLTKAPGISEAITWAGALTVFGAEELSVEAAERTLSVVVKYPEDEQSVREAGLASVVRHD